MRPRETLIVEISSGHLSALVFLLLFGLSTFSIFVCQCLISIKICTIIFLLWYTHRVLMADILLKRGRSICSIYKDTEGFWSLYFREGNRRFVSLRNWYCSKYIIILHFEDCRSVVITRDMMRHRDWHCLKLHLFCDN